MRQPVKLPVEIVGLFISAIGFFSLMSGIAPSRGIGLGVTWVRVLIRVFGFRGMRIISTILGVGIIVIGALVMRHIL